MSLIFRSLTNGTHPQTRPAHKLQADELVGGGDQPDLEVTMALMGGAFAVHVQTGYSEVAETQDYPPGDQPQLSLSGVCELLELLE